MTPERFSRLRTALARRQPDLTVLMDSVNKSHNVSAILRTADAVALQRLHAISTNAAMRRHHMIAGGAKRWVELVLHPSTELAVAALRADGFRLVAAHAGDGARDFRDVDYTQKTALMVGAELIGLSAQALAAADELVAIPMHGLGHLAERVGGRRRDAARSRAPAPHGRHVPSCRLSPEEFERTLFEWCYPDIAARCRELTRATRRSRPTAPLTANPLLAP